MATNTFVAVKSLIPEQNLRVAERPMIAARFFNGSKSVQGTVEDASSPGDPIAGRRMRLFTSAGVLIDETYSGEDGTYSFINLRDDINEISEGLIVTKQRIGVDGYAQIRDRLSAV